MNLSKKTKLVSIILVGFLSVLVFTNFTEKKNNQQYKKMTQFQETRVINGTILDETGNPLMGVKVGEKNTKNQVTTGKDGKFTVTVASNSIVSFSKKGYRPFELNATLNPRDPKFNPHLKVTIVASDLKDRTNTGYVTLCCNNHSVKHCSDDLSQLVILAERNGCDFSGD